MRETQTSWVRRQIVGAKTPEAGIVPHGKKSQSKTNRGNRKVTVVLRTNGV